MPTPFTPGTALMGGALIGLAVLTLFLAMGRVAGISGMATAVLRPETPRAERAWRLAFIAGLLIGPLIATAAVGFPLIRPSPVGAPLLMVAGLAVGLGSGLANGCTSGHGVCGVSRLSPRSLAATAVFMTTGVLAASVLRHLFGA